MNTTDKTNSSRTRVFPSSMPPVDNQIALRATVERSNHGQRLVVREGVQRVQDGITALLRSGSITPAHQSAAERYYRDYATGIHGVTDSNDNRSRSGCGDLHTSMLARAAAIGRVNTIRRAVGIAGTRVIHLLVLDGLSFRAMGAALYPGKAIGGQWAQAQAELMLELLAELYASMDRERKPASGMRSKQDAT